jgi:hypothetical protein
MSSGTFQGTQGQGDLGPIFHTFWGKFRGKFSPKKCWDKMEFSAEKVLKNRFPRNSAEFSAKKMYEKSAPDDFG